MNDNAATTGRVKRVFCLNDFERYMKMLDDVRGDLAVLRAVPSAIRCIRAHVEELESYLGREIEKASLDGEEGSARTDVLIRVRNSLIGAVVCLVELVPSDYEKETFKEGLEEIEKLLYLAGGEF